jgi:hypothetical protein
MTQETPTPRELARALVGRRMSQGTEREPSAGEASRDVCERLYDEFSRWVGIDGSYALFNRSMLSARVEHPALRRLILHARGDLLMEGVDEAVQRYGERALVDGLEAMLVRLIDLLGLLIGDDMATTLVLQATPSGPDGAAPGGGRATGEQ